MNVIRKNTLKEYGEPIKYGTSTPEIKKEIKRVLKGLAPELNCNISVSTRAYLEDLTIIINNNNLYKSFFNLERYKIDNHYIMKSDLNSWDMLHDVKKYYFRINQPQNFENVRELLKDKYNFIFNMIINKAITGGVFERFQIRILIEPTPANWSGFNPNIYKPANKHVNDLIHFLSNKNNNCHYMTGREYNNYRENRALHAKLNKIQPDNIINCDYEISAVFPHLNKNNTIKENDAEIKRNPEYCRAHISKMIIIKDKKNYNLFVNNLLNDFNFITGGGTYKNDRGELVRECIAVNDLLIDSEGYTYARYVGRPQLSAAIMGL